MIRIHGDVYSPRFMIGDRNGDVVEHTSRIGKAAKEVD